MKYVYWTCFPLLIVIGITLSVYFGLQPKTVPKITYSYFNEPAKVSDAILISESQELKAAPLVLLGVMPDKPYQLEVWKAFLQQNEIPSLKYQVLVVDQSLAAANNMFPSAVKLDVKADLDRFVEGVKNAQAQGLRMAVIVPIYYSVPMLRGNFLGVLKEKGIHPATFSIADYPRSADQEKEMEIPCVFTHAESEQGTGPLGCAIENKAKSLYRKEAKAGMYDGVMDQVGEKDYLLLLNTPPVVK